MFDLKSALDEYDVNNRGNTSYNDRVVIDKFIEITSRNEKPSIEFINSVKNSINNIKNMINNEKLYKISNKEFINLWLDNFLVY